MRRPTHSTSAPGMRGVLQLVQVDVGAQVLPGANLCPRRRPDPLMAQVQIAETQARDMQIGQSAQIDTHNGVAIGNVSRVAPSVRTGP